MSPIKLKQVLYAPVILTFMMTISVKAQSTLQEEGAVPRAQIEELKANGQIQHCNPENFERSPVGQKCVTSKGAVFEKVLEPKFGIAWKGPDGLIWSDNQVDSFWSINKHQLYRDDAFKRCYDIGGKVPTLTDFENAEAQGFREILNTKKYYYWVDAPLRTAVAPYGGKFPWEQEVSTFSYPTSMHFNGHTGEFQYRPIYRTSMGHLRCVSLRENEVGFENPNERDAKAAEEERLKGRARINDMFKPRTKDEILNKKADVSSSGPKK